jgi:hypothetical protein
MAMNDEELVAAAAEADDIVDDGVSDVLAEEQVQVPESVAEQAQSLDFEGDTFVADIPDWDTPDSSPTASQ